MLSGDNQEIARAGGQGDGRQIQGLSIDGAVDRNGENLPESAQIHIAEREYGFPEIVAGPSNVVVVCQYILGRGRSDPHKPCEEECC
jgi:hypothetical protein